MVLCTKIAQKIPTVLSGFRFGKYVTQAIHSVSHVTATFTCYKSYSFTQSLIQKENRDFVSHRLRAVPIFSYILSSGVKKKQSGAKKETRKQRNQRLSCTVNCHPISARIQDRICVNIFTQNTVLYSFFLVLNFT